MLEDYLPKRVNTGRWVPAYTLDALRELPEETEFVLPVCSLGTSYSDLEKLGTFILPPLFREALTTELKDRLVSRIVECFPNYASAENRKRVKVVELPEEALPETESPRILAFSVDTAVEEHGPHLPLGTDTIQSYRVLDRLASEFTGFHLARPLEYGQLTWGLPFGYSVDITTGLLTPYVTGYCNAVIDWLKPEALYVVDVHGSITHRQAIVDGLRESNARHWAFRWLHDPLPEFASERGDQHAGGVETILVERVSKHLLDSSWWPDRIDELAARQMSFEKAVELTPNLDGFCEFVKEHHSNGIIGDIHNYHRLDKQVLFGRMLEVARSDVQKLFEGKESDSQSAGQNLW